MHLNDRRFSQHLVIGPLSTSASHVDHIIRKSFWAIFISIETYWDALRPSSPLDFSEWLLMTKTYGYEGVFIDLENDRGLQEMILKWCPPKHLSLLTFPSLPSFRFRSLFAIFFWRQVQIDHQQTHVHRANNITEHLPASPSWLPDRQCPHQRRTLNFFIFFSSTLKVSFCVSFAFPFSFDKHAIDRIWPFAGWCRRCTFCKRYDSGRVYSSVVFYRFLFPARRPDFGTNLWL